jgi:hypothetical protein
MSEFILSLTREGRFMLSKTELDPDFNAVIVGRRDPDVPIEWKVGTFYYHPYNERRTVYIYRGDGKMISLEGHALAGRALLKDRYERGWFEVIPQPIQPRTLSQSIKNMIEAIPQQIKPISQALLQHSIRVPADFKPNRPKDWFDWLSTVQIPITPLFLSALRFGSNNKITPITREVELEFLTGKVQPKSKQIHIRMYRFREITRRVRQIYDTPYVVVDVPDEVLTKGPEATREWIFAHSDIETKFLIDTTPVSEKVLREEVLHVSESGVVAYERDSSNATWKPLWPVASSLVTASDIIREIMEEQP